MMSAAASTTVKPTPAVAAPAAAAGASVSSALTVSNATPPDAAVAAYASAFSELTIAADPMDQFELWWAEHTKLFAANDENVNEMCISTCSTLTGPPAANGGADTKSGTAAAATAAASAFPSARMVLLKSFNRDTGFRFFTNYNSRKGKDLTANPNCSLLFYWRHLRRQIRVEGVATRISSAESDAYFASRAVDSQVNASISDQSAVVPGDGTRKVLIDRVADFKAKHDTSKAGAIKRPPQWGGFDIKPTRIEFWQNSANRLHDRIRYQFIPAVPATATAPATPARWERDRLFP